MMRLPAADNGRHVPLLEHVFVIVALLMCARAIVPVVRSSRGVRFDPSQGDAALRSIFIGIYALMAIFILVHIEDFLRAIVRDKFVLALVLLPTLSSAWSTHPEFTLRRSLALFLTSMFGFYVASRYRTRQQLRLFAVVLLIALALSVVFALVFPSLGVMSGIHQGAWRGVFLHKNAFGRMMDLALIVFTLLALGRQRGTWFWWGAAALSLVAIVLSRSAGALVVALVLLAMLPLARFMQRSRSAATPFLIVTLMAVGTVAIVAYADFTTVLGILGKDRTLTGRTDLWAFALDMIRQKPILGYGYDGFWLGWDGPSAFVWQEFDWLPPHAHNGMIDLWLDLGAVGVALFLASLLYAFRLAIATARAEQEWDRLWPFMFLSFLLLANAGESVILKTNDLVWVAYVTTISSIGAARVANNRIARGVAAHDDGEQAGRVRVEATAVGRHLP